MPAKAGIQGALRAGGFLRPRLSPSPYLGEGRGQAAGDQPVAPTANGGGDCPPTPVHGEIRTRVALTEVRPNGKNRWIPSRLKLAL